MNHCELPITPDRAYEIEIDVAANISVAANRRTRKVRYKSDGTPPVSPLVRGWTFKWTDRETWVWRDLVDFYKHHLLHVPFYWDDVELDERYLVLFDSKPTSVPTSYNRLNFTAIVRQWSEDKV